jgi:hypothetical protein
VRFRVKGRFRCQVRGLTVKVRFRVYGLGFKFEGLGFLDQFLDLRVQGLGSTV